MRFFVTEGCSPFRYRVSPNKHDAYTLVGLSPYSRSAINAEVEEHRLGVTAPPGDPKPLPSQSSAS